MAINVERLRSKSGVLIVLLVGSFISVRVSAQQAIVPLQFSFSDPGARSMGFGGAFVALADDATAAFANPAGLVQLLRPEVSIEGRRWSYSTPFTEGGRIEGLPSGNGIDSTVGLRTATSKYADTELSFISLVYPMQNWALAFFRHGLANLEFFGETQGLFSGGTDCCQDREPDQRATSDMEIVSYGLSAAYRISAKLHLGLGAVYHDTSLSTSVTQYLWDEDSIQSFFAPNSYLFERSLVNVTTLVDDADWTLTGGLLWRLSPSWSIGGVYRQGLKIENTLEGRAGQAGDFGVPPGEVFARRTGVGIKFPDIYGLGFAYRAPDGRLTVTFQWDRVNYSSIAKSLELDDQVIDDADELHLGAEYVFLGSSPIIAVRFGTWLDPDHEPRATIDDPLLRALLPGGDDDMHYAAGIGVAMQSFQIDFGVDFGERVDAVSLSAIYNF
ncbi:MAG: outer membrane protein transport protein [Gammaproteobacteria bacterium]|nr:outer membrane protein transport protein [Gammaproteobacteria bacterium]